MVELEGVEARKRSGMKLVSDLPPGYRDDRARMFDSSGKLYLAHPDCPPLTWDASDKCWRDLMLGERVVW